MTDNISAINTASGNALPTGVNIDPKAKFTNTPDSGDPLMIDLDASDSNDRDGSTISFAGDFGDGNTSTSLTASHTYPSAGTYNVSLTVIDNDGQTSTISSSLVVVAPLPEFVSDYFNAPALDTNLWTFVNPKNDGAYSVST